MKFNLKKNSIKIENELNELFRKKVDLSYYNCCQCNKFKLVDLNYSTYCELCVDYFCTKCIRNSTKIINYLNEFNELICYHKECVNLDVFPCSELYCNTLSYVNFNETDICNDCNKLFCLKCGFYKYNKFICINCIRNYDSFRINDIF